MARSTWMVLAMGIFACVLNYGVVVTAFSSTALAASTASTSTATTSSKLASTRISEDLGIFDETIPPYDEDNPIIPVTIISGFLGSGKTTLLQHLLENKSGDCPIGLIVNDVADVNIDGKLVKTMEGGKDSLVELENGCACCSLSDELLNGVSELVTLSDLRRNNNGDGPNSHLKPFKHIVVEMSGVSDPRNIRATFQEAEQMGMVLMERIRLDTMVTVVDAELFEEYFQSEKLASRKESPQLFREEDSFEMEDWMKDVPPELLKAVVGHRGLSEEESNGVAELLVGQTETADVILLNKCDLLANDSDKIDRLRGLVKALNPRPSTTVLESSYGVVELEKILAVAKGEGVALSGAVDDHREFISAASNSNSHEHSHDHQASDDDKCTDPECTDPSHSHDHSHSHSHEATTCTDPDCTEDHDHSHSHSHEATACTDPDCTEDHDHSHSRSHEATICNDPTCTEDHDHSHSHSHEATACTEDHDHTHSHSHSHSHSHEENSTHAGIGTFVYKARRPFHPQRMLSFLRSMPIARGIPETELSSEESTLFDDSTTKQVLKSVLRSKGFVWCADSHSNSMYWSHAGASFEYKCLGRWWATLPRNEWPEGVDEYVLKDFDDISHPSEGVAGEMVAPESVGDRRQEVVFIGLGFGKLNKQEIIRNTLDKCLLTDQEYEKYRSICFEETEPNGDPDMLLHGTFPAVLESEYINY